MALEQNPKKRTWQEIAREASLEEDSVKLTKLCRELNDVLLQEERLKVQQRFGAATS